MRRVVQRVVQSCDANSVLLVVEQRSPSIVTGAGRFVRGAVNAARVPGPLPVQKRLDHLRRHSPLVRALGERGVVQLVVQLYDVESVVFCVEQ